jgi:hypothetical protein
MDRLVKLGAVIGSVVAASIALLLSIGVSPAMGSGSQRQMPGAYALASIGAQAVPTVTIQYPSSTTGDLGANLGNVWDMDSTDDIIYTQENFPVVDSPDPGTIVRGYIPHGAVLGFGLYGHPTDPLDSVLYHHLTFRLRISEEGTKNGCITNGRAALATRYPNWYGSQMSTFPYAPHNEPMNCAYGDYCVYYMDLSRNDNSTHYQTWQGSTSIYDPSPWPLAEVRGFALVPHEWCILGGAPDYFDVDYVYLTGEIVAREEDNYLYTAKWNVSDPDATTEVVTVTSRIRYQAAAEMLTPAESPACDAGNFDRAWSNFDPAAEEVTVLSGSEGPSYPYKIFLPLVTHTTPQGDPGPSNASYELDFSDDNTFSDGTVYYLCIRASDGENDAYAVSSAPIIRAPLPPMFWPN